MSLLIIRAWIRDVEMLDQISTTLKNKQADKLGKATYEYIEYNGKSSTYSKFIGRILFHVLNVDIVPDLIKTVHIINNAHIEILIDDEWKGLTVGI